MTTFSSEGGLSEENTSELGSQPHTPQLCSSLSTENLQLELQVNLGSFSDSVYLDGRCHMLKSCHSSQANIGSDGLSDKECVVRRMKTQVRQSTDRLAQVSHLQS